MTTLDVSNYDYGTFDAACLKAAGVDQIIVGCQRPQLAREMIEQARAAGIKVIGVYAYLYFDVDTLGQTMTAIGVAQEYGIGTVWLDVEDTSSRSSSRESQLQTCVDVVIDSGLRAGIYTGGWYWPSYMLNTTAFSYLPLWHSDYGYNDGTYPPVTEVAYGGWTKVAIHQYTSTLNLCGRHRDANYVLEEEPMTADELARLERLERIVGGEAADQIDLLESHNNLNAAVTAHVDHHPGSSTVSEHTHEPGKVANP